MTLFEIQSNGEYIRVSGDSFEIQSSGEYIRASGNSLGFVSVRGLDWSWQVPCGGKNVTSYSSHERYLLAKINPAYNIFILLVFYHSEGEKKLCFFPVLRNLYLV